MHSWVLAAELLVTQARVNGLWVSTSSSLPPVFPLIAIHRSFSGENIQVKSVKFRPHDFAEVGALDSNSF